jgi:hypothetical protein
MAHCSSLDETGRVVRVEDMDEALVAAELERAFREEPTVNPAGEGVPSEGATMHMHYFGASTITVGKIKRWKREVILRRTRLACPGLKLCRSHAMMKLWCLKIYLLHVCACLRIRPWLIFCYTSRHSCTN